MHNLLKVLFIKRILSEVGQVVVLLSIDIASRSFQQQEKIKTII